MNRKIIAISSAGVENTQNTQCNHIVIALCDDGTLWSLHGYDVWQQIRPLPEKLNWNTHTTTD